jgi:hypothetical protein
VAGSALAQSRQNHADGNDDQPVVAIALGGGRS